VNFEQYVQTTETSTPKTKGTNGTQLKMFLGHEQHCSPLQLLLHFSGTFTTTKYSMKFPQEWYGKVFLVLTAASYHEDMLRYRSYLMLALNIDKWSATHFSPLPPQNLKIS